MTGSRCLPEQSSACLDAALGLARAASRDTTDNETRTMKGGQFRQILREQEGTGSRGRTAGSRHVENLTSNRHKSAGG